MAGDPEISWSGQIAEAKWQAGHRSLSGLSLFHGPRYSFRLGFGRSGLPQHLAGHAMSLWHCGLYSEKTRVAFPLFCTLGVTQLNDSIWGRKKTRSSKATYLDSLFQPISQVTPASSSLNSIQSEAWVNASLSLMHGWLLVCLEWRILPTVKKNV